MQPPLRDILDGVEIPFAYKLGYLINSYREPSFRAIEATHGLTRPEILSLIFLSFRDGISAADICDFPGHPKNNIGRAITAAGRRLHDRFMPALQKREEDMRACLSAAERASVEALLRKLCAHGPESNGKEHWLG